VPKPPDESTTTLATTLADTPVGGRATVVASTADPALTRRLAELGIRPGAPLTVVQRTAGGGRVIDTGSARYAVDHRTLSLIGVHND
jgi:ferrous iron transport protein A